MRKNDTQMKKGLLFRALHLPLEMSGGFERRNFEKI